MKKIILYSTIILLIVIITASGTYAFFSAINGTGNVITSNASKLDVIYTGGTEINGNLKLVKPDENAKFKGFNTTVRIRLAEDSVDAKADLYIQIEQITAEIATEGLVWEVYKTYKGEESFVDSGTFAECTNGNTTKKCANGDRLYIVKNYQLTTTDTYYTVYIWLNGEKVGNEVLDAILKAYIGAETEEITTNLNNYQ